MTVQDPLQYGWWLASRASGLVALALVTLSVGVGLAMAGRVARRPGLSRTLAALHQNAAIAGLIAICVHGLTLLADPWLHPGPVGVVVPFAMHYRPLYSGLGIVAGYLAALLGLSFYARRRIGPRRWRRLHRATVLVYVLGVAHAVGAGSDASTPWLRGFLLVTGVPIAALFVRRITAPRPAPPRRTGSAARRKVSDARRPVSEVA
ncbi:MAG: ferric reductase-like transmembrane domain-containing protein [Solirubrobacteraceae bacterium]